MNDSKPIGVVLENMKTADGDYTPRFFDLKVSADRATLAGLIASKEIRHVADDYKEQLNELFAIQNPTLVYTPEFKAKLSEYVTALERDTPLSEQGIWVYYPWRSTLCHVLPREDFFAVHTARNRLLINLEEQEHFSRATIGIAGLSVGSNIAFALALEGGPIKMKLADMDRLALTNTNRVLSGVNDLGLLKVEMVARRLYEMNPYLDIECFSDGLTKENIERFFDGLDIVVDELDNLAVKYLIRVHAQKHRIAVVMGADNGDNAVIDVERYDLDPNTPYFHGRLGDVTYESLSGLDKFGIGKTITKHIGVENITERMQESLLEMGKTIVSWPQLGGAALLNGVAVAYCVRKILNKEPVVPERALLVIDRLLTPNYDTPANAKRRASASAKFASLFGL